MQLKDEKWEDLYLYAKELSEQGLSFQDIEKKLKQRTEDSLQVAEIIKLLKQVSYALKRKSGLLKLGFASLFLVAGFFITCFNFHSNQSFTLVMYSFTSIGLALLLWGLYEIIG